ncbi:MAG: hypothetical protein AAB445_00860 [Patescibacteria group bacterium]
MQKRTTSFLVSISILLALSLPMYTHAITIEGVGATLYPGNAAVENTTTKTIQLVLGLMGLIAVAIILYGVYIKLKARGNAIKVRSAKKIISTAIVGLIVILISWTIVTFVIGTTTVEYH